MWVALVVLPFALLGALEPSAAVLSWAAIFLLTVLGVADALCGRRRLAGIRIELPELVRLSKDREGQLEVRVQNPARRALQVRLALMLPPELLPAHEAIPGILPAEAEWSRLAWSCVPLKRGNYRLASAHVETSSPIGFWSARRALGVKCEVRVYPNLFRERRDLAGLFLHRGTFGFHARRQVGKGREFEKLREYSAGDSYDEIHWKATARRGRPITKVFQIERTQEVYVVIDASRLSARQVAAAPPTASRKRAEDMTGMGLSEPATTLERFITAALLLGLAAEQQGDFFGLLTFSDQVGRFVRARNGKAHYHICRDILYALEPRMVSPDFDEVCTFIRLRMRRRALLIFLTALDDPVVAESFVRNVDLIRSQHLVLVNMLQPPGVAPLFSSPEVSTIDDLYRDLGGHLQWHNLRELEKVLQRRGVRFSLLKNERLSAQLAAQYLEVKRRQLL
jgi:uncharacterized protein (DUF58 family)